MRHLPLPAPTRRALLAGGALTAGLMMAPRIAAAQVQANLARVDALIARMTIEEKAGQLTLQNDPFRWRPEGVNPGDTLDASQEGTAAEIRAGRIGALFNGVGAATTRLVQEMAVKDSRLGIPLLFAADIVHGLKTTFPVPLGEAASWDVDLAERTARAAAVEGGAAGVHQTYAPMVDIGRDQRWGRVVEGSGEDVLLGNLFAAARTKGFQGDDLKAWSSLLACPKHFVAYGAAQAGLDYNSTDMSELELRSVYLPAFKAAFDAGALSTMSGFNDLNGVPTSGNKWLLTDILRGEWGFTGFVVSDYTSEQELVAHGYAADDRDATRLALMAGVDMSMKSGLYIKHIPGLVQAGEVPVARVDEAVRRVLMTKAALGLFENPYRGSDVRTERRVHGSREHLALAREAGRKSIVMLKNDGGLLPLAKTGQRIALIGPFGADRADLFGPWSIFKDEDLAVSLEQGLRAAMGDGASLSVVKGSDVEAPLDGGIEAAVIAASQADVVLLAIGESTNMSAEAQSRADIGIPEPQLALAEAVAATGKPVVVILRHGRAMELSGAVKDAPAILATWFLGSETGHAVADILFGDHAPTGRLPVSFPHLSGQSPFHYAHKSTGRPAASRSEGFKAQFRETSNTALYPFGHGLTYAPVAYSAVRLSAPTMAWNGGLTATVTLSNSGSREASEVVQLYIRDRAASITQPVRLLKGFRRVTVPAGGSVEVSIPLTFADLLFLGPDLEPTVEPGLFDVWLAPDAQAGEAAQFTLNR
ncbi:MAG: glycoside hydrolase family 3 C-terminal domain-containing protein [Alphaproteobacteria bacterium]|nr:glycoside hydrolase family 3 C-terminal domain-containing protein [Alphaproteobacteria bacterium]MBU2270200.1 glycoside hydrolase family 3 C-terminal domain-containing protein [Alphaproteobacteria bacterium]MBU2417683.1 glycoside hydrolase family 3 C-terminal domain-containing protein [Alphaproteobacteria bacterium]